MKAVRIHETGSPDVLQYEDVDAPRPGAGEVLLRIAVAGVNFTDVMARQGVYLSHDAAIPLPAVLGTEVAGLIVSAGPGVDTTLIGRRVVAFVHGGYAEYAVADVGLITDVPHGVDLGDSVAFLVQGVTALQLLEDCARVRPGQSVLVHAAAGGVGTLAVQLAKRLGAATVIATASSPAKRRLAIELGADAAIDYTEADWTKQVLDLTDGRGADVVLDAVGGDVGEQSLGCLAPFGRLVVYGVSSKQFAPFAGSQLMRHNQSVIGYWLTSRLTPGSGAAGQVARLLAMAAAGDVRAVIRHAYPLDAAAEAHRALAARSTVGKIILTP